MPRICSKVLLLAVSAVLAFPPIALAQRATPSTTADPWWKHAVIYEVYPRSFADTNGDGIGDLNGITEHLDYLHKLGVDTVWLAPIYPSPNVDFGYDVADYTAVNPEYGTLADFDHLLAEAKKRNMNIVMDMVLNHTSDKNPWFLEGASSRTNPKADWYVWNDGIPADSPNLTEIQKQNIQQGPHGKVVPPNNWGFRVSAWQWVPARQQFYYHAFSAAQPDLNWRNPAVEKAMFDAMRFWLDRGVAGFRLDAIETIYEDPGLRNIPTGGNRMAARGITTDLPEVHDLLRRMRAMTDSYPGQRVLIGELFARDMPSLDAFYGGAAKDELQLPMDYFYGFPALLSGNFNPAGGANKDKLDVDYYRKHLLAMSTELHGSQPLIFFDNHDRERSIDRFGDGTHNVEIAKVVAALLLTPPATAQLYYGQAIGMVTTPPTRKEDVRDGFAKNSWPRNKGRDGERTPMQWTPGPQAGFSTNPNTWLPIPPSYVTTNVQTEEAEPDSLLRWYQQLTALRRSNAALRNGNITLVDKSNASVLSFIRATAGHKPVVVMMNFTAATQSATIHLSEAGITHGKPRLLLATPGVRPPASFENVSLPAYGVAIVD